MTSNYHLADHQPGNSGSEAFLTYLKDNQPPNRSSVQKGTSDAGFSSAAVRNLLEKLKTSTAENHQNHQTSIRTVDQIPAPTIETSALANLNNLGLSSAAASGPSASAMAPNLGASQINHRYGYYPSAGSGHGMKYLGTISPHTFNAALTAIAFAAFLTFGLRLAVNALAGGRRRRRSTDMDDSSGAVDDEINELTNNVLPAIQRNWVDMPSFAPEVTCLGFEMLWNYWKEKGLRWSTPEEDERRICLAYRKVKGESKEDYQRARSSWAMLSRIGISWADPFLYAVDRGLKGLNCNEPRSANMKTWG